MDIAAGSRIGAYEVAAPIGAGGMGEVYRARDSRIGRDVAIKVLPAGAGANAERLRRFEQEARAAGSLNHPNLVTLFEMGEHDGRPYIAMELLEGETLREKLATRLPPRKAVEYAVQMANALAAAHARGVVHRDLKPENVFVTRDGRVKILDFGLAKLRGDGVLGPDEATVEGADTAPGMIMGTVGYMSPEQVRGQAVDHRTDIFSFGAILYEMLTGSRAFKRDSSVETMNAVLTDDPPELSGSGANVSPAIERVVRRCLEKSPAERFHSAHDVALALESISAGTTTEQRVPAPEIRRSRWPLLVAAVAMVALAAALAVLLARRPGGPAAAPLFNQLTFRRGFDGFPSLAPDAKTFAFVSDAGGNLDVYVQRVDGRNAINLTKDSPAADTMPAFSPDGSQIAFRSDRDGGGIFIVGATGESVRRLTDFGHNPAWSPDGTAIVVATEPTAFNPRIRNADSALWTVDVRSGAKRRLAHAEGVQPAWSPDGKWIAYWTLSSPAGGQRDLFLTAADGSTRPRQLTNDAAVDWNPVWSRDGSHLYFGSDRGGVFGLWRLAIEDGHASGEPEFMPTPTTFAAHFSLSSDGTQMVFSSIAEEASLEALSADLEASRLTGPARPIIAGSLMPHSMDLSPDGQWIVFHHRGQQDDLYMVKIDGSDVRQLTSDPEYDRAPSWSRDGREIYFYSARGPQKNFEIWKIRADGSGLTQITRGGNRPWYPRVGPDGKTLVMWNERGAWLFDGTSEQLLPAPAPELAFENAVWSPDGRLLAGNFRRLADAATIPGIVLYSMSEKTYRAVTDDGESPQWLDDNRIVYAAGQGLKQLDPSSGTTRPVELPAGFEPARAFTFSRDGRTAVASRRTTQSDVWLARLPSAPGN